jgi:hypothetical protein
MTLLWLQENIGELQYALQASDKKERREFRHKRVFMKAMIQPATALIKTSVHG